MNIPTDTPEARALVKAWLPLDRYSFAAWSCVGRVFSFCVMLRHGGRRRRSIRERWILSGFAMNALHHAVAQEKERLDRLRNPERWRE